MDFEPVQYRYNTGLKWTEEHKGILSSEGKPDIQVACPPEFGGHPNIWSPEDVFIAGVEICTFTTYLFLLEKKDIELVSYESSTEGVAQMKEGEFYFTDVWVRPKVVIKKGEDLEEAKKAMGMVKRICLVTKSIISDVHIEADISAE